VINIYRATFTITERPPGWQDRAEVNAPEMLALLNAFCEHIGETAHSHIMAELPVYTGTYAGSVDVELEQLPFKESYSVYISHESYTESAQAHEDEIQEMAGKSVLAWLEEKLTYGKLLEIELFGSPLGRGMNVWGDATEMCTGLFNDYVERLRELQA
jgi:hypothetical protein